MLVVAFSAPTFAAPAKWVPQFDGMPGWTRFMDVWHGRFPPSRRRRGRSILGPGAGAADRRWRQRSWRRKRH